MEFNIDKVIECYKLDENDLAKTLFPNAKHSKMALDRVKKGDGKLDTGQVEKLASYIGITVADLYSTGTWKSIAEDSCLTLAKGPYKAKLNYKGVFLTVYKDGVPIGQKISNVPDMLVRDFLDYLDILIKKYEKDGSI